MKKTFIHTIPALGLLLALPVTAWAGEDTTPSFTLDPIRVESNTLPALKELDPVGSQNQPLWTASERFSFSDVYVRPEGAATVGIHLVTDTGIHSNPHAADQFSQTLQVGLGEGWQIGVSTSQTDILNDADFGGKLEIRKAFAPWNVIWGNPTLAASYAGREGDVETLKIGVLFGGNIADRWSWSLNGGYERTFDQNNTSAAVFTGGVLYSIKDNVFAVGAEMVGSFTRTDMAGTSTHFSDTFVGVGPSVSWTPQISGHRLTVHGAALLLNGYSGDGVAPHNHIALGISYAF